MKKRAIGIALIVSLLCVACNTSQQGSEGELGETKISAEADESVRSDSEAEKETIYEDEISEQAYYEIQLEAEPLDKEAVAEAVFGTKEYEKEQLEGSGSWQYFADDSTVLAFHTDTYFTYGKAPYNIRYSALVASGWGAVMLQDMRLECLFPEDELSNGSKEEAEQVCDRIMEAMGYDYTEKSIYVIDPEFGNLMEMPSPSQTDSWEADDGAYLLIYRNGAIADVGAEVAFIDASSVCHMIYSPKYGLCYINMEPVFHEVSRQEVEVITEEEAREQTAGLFQIYGIPYGLVEVTGYELVYCENPYAMDAYLITGSVVPCWKISFRPKESDAALWKEDWGIVRGTSMSEGYLILDARVGGSVTSFYPTPGL